MKQRLERGLKKKRDLGFTAKAGAMVSCGCETFIMPYMPLFVTDALQQMEEAFDKSNK